MALLKTVGIIYISLNVIITIIVSVFGAKFVRTEFLSQKEKANEQSVHSVDITVKKTQDDDDEPKIDAQIPKEAQNNELNKMSFIKLWFKIAWKMRSVYVSLAVHTFDVLTDILVLIEWWYLEDETKGGQDIDHIDSRLMALCAIATLALHKTVSTLAFWIKEKSIYRCILQLFDVLIFEEIYISHKRVLNQFKNQSQESSNDPNTKRTQDAVETTSTFKYIRSLEAVFESIPQSVLQLVFIIRSGNAYYRSTDVLIISYFSIFQSILSMTNSIIKNDNVYMTADKWKKHRQRLPPTMPFLKHAFCRLSEVVYRITLLALFWTVCGGKAFAVLLAVEIALILILSFDETMSSIGIENITPDEMFLRIQMLVILPSELVFAADGTMNGLTNCGYLPSKDVIYDNKKKTLQKRILYTLASVIYSCCCCFWPAVLITRCSCDPYSAQSHYVHPDFRIGISIMEYVIMIIFGIMNQEEQIFLFSLDYGLTIFIIGCVAFIVYTQYLRLFPNFSLPFSVGIRSRYGYAFIGELDELQRIKDPEISFRLKNVHFERIADLNNKLFDIDAAAGCCRDLLIKYMETICDMQLSTMNIAISDINIDTGGRESLKKTYFTLTINEVSIELRLDEWITLIDQIQSDLDQIYGEYMLFVHDEDMNPWDIAPAGAIEGVTCAMYALGNEQYNIVQWLENEKKVRKHRLVFKNQSNVTYNNTKRDEEKKTFEQMDSNFARSFLGEKYF